MFINPQDDVYQGMVIGENSRDNDLDVNVLKGKKLPTCVPLALMMPLC